ncbi:MAG: hypothetical protein K9K30_06820 [Burkholderiaceae bacterium]|nr:hypothetical protein [Sulfuritalea sp.]MCF8174938.1 hypothetical protein [Burkholderiaceae bacterium]MCF8184527.1 hypothetical protein [Polynucleobacter sp.]
MADDETAELLQKADALIRRTRVFVAGSSLEKPDVMQAAAEEDLPILTDIVTEDEAALATAPPHMQRHLDALREELSRWLDQELPQAVLKVTDGLADQLMGELTHQAEKNLLPRMIARLDGTSLEAESDS